jgi:hypothetical protein
MKRLLLLLTSSVLIATLSAHADWNEGYNTNDIPALLSSTNYESILQISADKLTPEQRTFIERIQKGKAPTRDAASRVLAERTESRKWLADARWFPKDEGLYELAYSIDGFGKKGDPIWVSRVYGMGRQLPGFLVNSRTGDLLRIP